MLLWKWFVLCLIFCVPLFSPPSVKAVNCSVVSPPNNVTVQNGCLTNPQRSDASGNCAGKTKDVPVTTACYDGGGTVAPGSSPLLACVFDHPAGIYCINSLGNAADAACVEVPGSAGKGTCGSDVTPPPGGCGGMRGSCSGSCPSGQVCRAPSVLGNGDACGCHPSGGGGCDKVYYECRKGCNAVNRGDVCGKANTPPYEDKYDCRMCCRNSPPTAPPLVSPANNAKVSTETVTLQWQQPASWGSTCGEANKRFKVYWGYTNNPTNLFKGNIPSTTTSTQFTGIVGKTYYWKVIASNGPADNAEESVVRRFTVSPVAINVRAVEVSNLDTSCAALAASTTGLTGTVQHKFTPGSPGNPGSKTQVGVTPVQFTNLASGTYTLNPTVPSIYALENACFSKTGGASWIQRSSLAVNTVGGDSVIWNIGYIDTTVTAVPWTQTSGGDVYGAGGVVSPISAGATPRTFITDGGGGFPGLATYGQSYNFDDSAVDKGASLTSSTKWLVQDSIAKVDYYTLFYRRFGGTPTSVDYVNPTSPITKPATRYNTDGSVKPYYVTGDMTTSGDWTVGNGESLVFFVDGNLTIAGKINITGTGFVGFIVNGNISIDPTVGVAAPSSAPVVEGVYITSPTGVFQTNTNDPAADTRFVGRGMFIAGSFALNRDLDPAATNGLNVANAAELFIYNPRLLITMPDRMRESPISWQEVAP